LVKIYYYAKAKESRQSKNKLYSALQ